VSDTEILLIRHAVAGDRAHWHRADVLRPLTDVGRRQARALAELFADRPIAHLLSSPYVRCLQSMEPLAAARGLPIETSDDLAEGRPWELVEKLALELAGDGPGALCVHGDVMEALIEDLRERGVGREENPGGYAKGSTWILRVRDGTIVSARYVPPPPVSVDS
jgi:8-oxo-dGTP diphosphatase